MKKIFLTTSLLLTLIAHAQENPETNASIYPDHPEYPECVTNPTWAPSPTVYNTCPPWDFDKYLNAEETVEKLKKINANNKKITNLILIGETNQKRKIYGLEISNHINDPLIPVVLFDGTHHAGEVMGGEVVMDIADYMTKNQNDIEVKNWLDNLRVVIIPQVNPDGNDIVHTQLTNLKNVDSILNKAFYQSNAAETYPNDDSPNKYINSNTWRKNAYNYDTSTKGLDLNAGVDLNRNYPTFWDWSSCTNQQTEGDPNDPTSYYYHGPSPGSEPETQAMMNFVKQYKPIADIDYHAFGEMIIYPYGCKIVDKTQTILHNSATNLFKTISNNLNNNILNDQNIAGQYKVGTPSDLLYSASGSFLDWEWSNYGVLGIAIEVNSDSVQIPYDLNDPRPLPPNSTTTSREETLPRQRGGWSTFLNSMLRSGVTAQIQAENIDKITYTVTEIDQKQSSFDCPNSDYCPVIQFPIRSESGLLYQILNDKQSTSEQGKYELTFYNDKKPVGFVKVSLENSGMTELHKIKISQNDFQCESGNPKIIECSTILNP